jgi:phenylalanyl-tRNA synthetase beta chain
MKISINWLQEYISLSETPQEIANLLTQSGLEVSHIESLEPIPGSLAGLLIGQVMACTKHPNADKLRCTQVDIGVGKPLAIVCGAPNVAVGQKVVVAPVGTTLHTYTSEKIHIKATKIRGELSEGMLCAEDEIGLGPSHEQILTLDTNLPPGTPVNQYFKLKTDHVLTIDLTPNRIDACSHLGVARELRALLNRPIQYPTLLQEFTPLPNPLPIQVSVENAHVCPRYTGIVIAGVQVRHSPKWIQDKLQAIGLHPINNVVDITNLVMYELGQPLHAFDYDQIAGNKVEVRLAQVGEKISTLDGVDRTLVGKELLVADASNNIALAGILGGKSTAVTPGTTHIFLESAYFAPQVIRQAATHHKLQTDAAFRFERGTDPHLPIIALKRACLLLREVAGGKIASHLIDIYPQPIQGVQVAVSYKNIQQLIGQSIPPQEIQRILHNLDITTSHDDGEQFTALVPPYRVDVTREIDIIEEILRIYGYDKIQLPAYLQSTFLATKERPRSYQITHQFSTILAANGYQEICTNSLIAQQEAVPSKERSGQAIFLLNPLSDRLNMLRHTLLFSGLEVLAYNINRKQVELKLFEFGKNYYQQDGSYIEKNKLGIWLTGKIEATNWIRKPREATFQDLNTILHTLLEWLGVHPVYKQAFSSPWYKYGIQVSHQSNQLATIGQLADSLVQKAGIKQTVFFADIDIDQLSAYPTSPITYKPLSKFPAVKRDLSLVIDHTVLFEDMKRLLATQQEPLVKDVYVFDVYHGANLPAGKKAYALSFTLQDQERTLDDKTINQVMARLVNAFQKILGAVIRE